MSFAQPCDRLNLNFLIGSTLFRGFQITVWANEVVSQPFSFPTPISFFASLDIHILCQLFLLFQTQNYLPIHYSHYLLNQNFQILRFLFLIFSEWMVAHFWSFYQLFLASFNLCYLFFASLSLAIIKLYFYLHYVIILNFDWILWFLALYQLILLYSQSLLTTCFFPRDLWWKS